MIFFALGTISLFAGVALWLPQLIDISIYPLDYHRILVVNGFLYFFITGFLTTALPQFTQTAKVKSSEVFFILIGAAVSLLGQSLGLVIQTLALLFFVMSRFIQKKQNPPFSFVLIPLGLTLLLFGAIDLGLNLEYQTQYEWVESAITLLIMGVGIRMIPALTGHFQIVQQQRQLYEKNIPWIKTFPIDFIISGLSYFIAGLVASPFSGWVKFLAIAYLLFKYGQIHKMPLQKTALSYGLWTSCWFFTLGSLSRLIWPDYGVHLAHIHFAGSFVMICLAVATRVLQAHMIKRPSIENSKFIYWIFALVVLAMATRVSATLLEDSYNRHLAYAAIVLIAALALWVFFLYRAYRDKEKV